MARQAYEAHLYWRDENYGRISGSHALRVSVEPALSDTAHLKMRRALKRHGFAFDEQRGSYIAPEALGTDAPLRVVKDFEAFGWQVSNHHAVPECLSDAEAEASPPAPR